MSDLSSLDGGHFSGSRGPIPLTTACTRKLSLFEKLRFLRVLGEAVKCISFVKGRPILDFFHEVK